LKKLLTKISWELSAANIRAVQPCRLC
jgi:hypothetical protein